jgi:hypothetical protein
MSSNPPPDSKSAPLTPALAAGAVLAAAAVGLFVLLWLALGSTGLSNAQRLFISLCVPPALLSGLIGAYILIRRPRA